MRAMEFAPDEGGEVDFTSLEPAIGQGAYHPPSVFNFFTQDFQPDGVVTAQVSGCGPVMTHASLLSTLHCCTIEPPGPVTSADDHDSNLGA